MVPSPSHAGIIDYSFSHLIDTPLPDWTTDYGNALYKLAFTYNTSNQLFTITALSIGSLNILSLAPTAVVNNDSNSPTWSYDINTQGPNTSDPYNIQDFSEGALTYKSPGSFYVNDFVYIYDPTLGTTASTYVVGYATPVPVPSPPTWLMMLTGLGILIPMHRRHVKSQRKGSNEGKSLVV